MQWIRRSFIAGCFVMVPLIISVAALVWAFRLIDGVMAPLYTQLLGQEVPGLGLATALLVVLVWWWAGAGASSLLTLPNQTWDDWDEWDELGGAGRSWDDWEDWDGLG